MLATQESTPTSAIPSSLVYEVLNGRPLYYRGYKEVLAKNLNPESVMGSSALQSILVSLIHSYIMLNRDKKKYIPVTNEAGVHLALTDNLSCDVAIFEKGTFEITTKYFDVAPKIVIEVDVKIDLTEFDGIEFNYVAEKNQRLFDFGVERVLWVLSKHRRVMIAQPNQDWIFTDWGNDITVMDGCILNVKKLLDEEEIVY
ncbi:Uma2 family endonuclease [Spirosoma gilvum]